MSLAGVITVCIGGVATHLLQAIRFVSRFIPAEPRPSLSMVLCLVTSVCIVCMVPVWVPLCMVAGLIFGVSVGTAHNFVALWTACTLSLMIGRYFFRVPIRERLFDGDLFAHRFLWRTSTRTDSWHSDSPRRHSSLTTETRYHGVVLTVEVPQFQFIDSVEDILVWQQRQVPWLFSPVEVPQILVINSVEDTPAVCFHSRIYPGLTLYGEEVPASFNRKFTSLAYCCEFYVPCVCRQGTTATGQCA